MSLEEQRAEPDREPDAAADGRRPVRLSKSTIAGATQPAASPVPAPERVDPRDALMAAFASHLDAAEKPATPTGAAAPRASGQSVPASSPAAEDEQSDEASDKIHRLGQQLLRMPAPLSDFDRRAIRAMATELIEIDEQIEQHDPAAPADAAPTARPAEKAAPTEAASVPPAPPVLPNPFLFPATVESTARAARPPAHASPTPVTIPEIEPPARAETALADAVPAVQDDASQRRPAGVLLAALAAIGVALLIVLVVIALRARQGSHRTVAAPPPATSAVVTSSTGIVTAGAPPALATAVQPTVVPAAASATQSSTSAATTASVAATTASAVATASVAQSVAATASAAPAATTSTLTATAVTATPAAPPSAATLVQRVEQAEAGLHTGDLTVVSDLGTGAKATATLTFDLGDAQHPPRLHITSVYSSPAGTQTDERIIIGGTSWQHQAMGSG